LWGAAGLDLLLGLLTLAPLRSRHWLWAAQIGLILFYSAVIALRLPEFWLHPYAPMVKNLPMLALLMLLWTLEPRRGRR
jgi:ABC-type amino acid transport system permease subunit